MNVSLLYVIILVTVLLGTECLVPAKFQWKVIDFAWKHGSLREKAIADGSYIPENNMPTGLARWRDKLFITIPRWKRGVPCSLNYVFVDGPQQQPLRPYPSWREAFVTEKMDRCPSNSTVVSTFRVAVDDSDRLWVVDNGVTDMASGVKQIADPAILVFDLKTDRLLHRYVFGDELRNTSVLTSIVVDDTCGCDNSTFAYITDMGSNALIVFDLHYNTAWRVESPHFMFDPGAGVYRVGGVDFYWSDGVSSAALSNNKRDGSVVFDLHYNTAWRVESPHFLFDPGAGVYRVGGVDFYWSDGVSSAALSNNKRDGSVVFDLHYNTAWRVESPHFMFDPGAGVYRVGGVDFYWSDGVSSAALSNNKRDGSVVFDLHYNTAWRVESPHFLFDPGAGVYRVGGVDFYWSDGVSSAALSNNKRDGSVVFDLHYNTAWRVESPHFMFDPGAGVYRVGGVDFYWSDGVSSAALSNNKRDGSVVFDLHYNTAWRVESPHFLFDPGAGVYRVGGVDFYWSDGVSSAALSNNKRDGSRDLYVQPTSSTKTFKISTDVVINKSASEEEKRNAVQVVGDRGPNSQATACDLDRAHNVMFFTQLSRNGVSCWNMDKPLSPENTPLIISDCNLLEFPNDVKVDKEGNLWILSDRQSRFLYSSMDYNQSNFRVLTAPAAAVVAGSACAPRRGSSRPSSRSPSLRNIFHRKSK